MTIVELTVSMLILVVAVGATLGTVTSFAGLEDSSEQTIRAWVGARRTLERLQAEDFATLFARYDDEPANDPGGAGTAPGPHFDVPGLDSRPGDADGLVGRILFPVSGATPGVLNEDRSDPDFGLPRDLNADGVIDAADHSGDYFALPVRVRVEWTGRSGNRAIQLTTLLVPR